MPSLGERLKANQETLEAQRLSKAAREDAAIRDAEISRHAAINAKFDDFKRSITSSIEHGNIVKAMKLPDSWTSHALSNNNNNCINNPKHQDYHLWQDFATWCHSEGLVPNVVYEHDGMGVRSWFMLTITPNCLT